MINKAVKNKAGIKFAQKRKGDTESRLLASVDRARKLIGYEPKIEFKEGLMNTIKWFKDNWKNIEQSASFGPGISSAVRDK
jgi:nucleoside-diphosphate-sugar epimerase